MNFYKTVIVFPFHFLEVLYTDFDEFLYLMNFTTIHGSVSYLYLFFFLTNCSFRYFALPPFVNFAFSGGHFSIKGN